MIGIDTNVLLRYIAQDDPKQSAAATRFVDSRLSSASPGHVSLVTLAEVVWVLRSRFAATAAEQVAAVAELLDDPRFVVQEHHAIWLALDACEQTEADLSDALIRFVDRAHGCTETVTFDRRSARLPGMRLLQ